MQILPLGDPAGWTLDNVGGLITNVTALALDLAGIVAVIYIIIGGINYLTAYGNEEKATAGKNTLLWAIVGLIVIILARVAVEQIMGFFRK